MDPSPSRPVAWGWVIVTLLLIAAAIGMGIAVLLKGTEPAAPQCAQEYLLLAPQRAAVQIGVEPAEDFDAAWHVGHSEDGTELGTGLELVVLNGGIITAYQICFLDLQQFQVLSSREL